MRRVLFYAAVSLPLAVTSVPAASLSASFTNMSGDTINMLAVSPKEATEVSIQNILAAPISNGESGTASLEADEGECVFNLTFTFASGKILERPDTDLCQSDGIVIE